MKFLDRIEDALQQLGQYKSTKRLINFEAWLESRFRSARKTEEQMQWMQKQNQEERKGFFVDTTRALPKRGDCCSENTSCSTTAAHSGTGAVTSGVDGGTLGVERGVVASSTSLVCRAAGSAQGPKDSTLEIERPETLPLFREESAEMQSKSWVLSV